MDDPGDGENPEQGKPDRELDDQREQASARGGAGLPLDPHQLLLHLLGLFLQFLLDPADLGLNRLEGPGRTGLLEGQREEEEVDADRQQDDGQAVGRDQVVEERQRTPEKVLKAVEQLHPSASSPAIRNRVDSARMEWMAAGYALHTEPAAPDQAETHDGIGRVLRTARLKPTAWAQIAGLPVSGRS